MKKPIHVFGNVYRGFDRPRDLAKLWAAGMNHVVNLQSGAEFLLTDSVYENQIGVDMERGGSFKYMNIWAHLFPCSNIWPPSFKTFKGIGSLVINAKRHDEKVVIHCHSDVDRTGFIVAMLRMALDNKDFAFAHFEWKIMGRHWWFFWWTPWLWWYSRKLKC